MPIIEPVIRPPAEADSFLLQVTTGCSANTCSFCGAYKGKPFTVKPLDEVINDIREYARRFPRTRRVFLMDGDALSLSNERLLPILGELNAAFPLLNRIASYANGFNIVRRSHDELVALYEQKVRLLYIGLESGAQDILDACNKRSSAEEMITAVNSASEAKIKSSVIVLLGLGGVASSAIHVKETITALNNMQPRYLSFLTVMIIPGTPLYDELKKGTFKELGAKEILRETRDIIRGLELTKTIFRTDHASNYLSLEGRFPQDKQHFLDILDQALEGGIDLRPEIFRGL
jgi:radical SAM superfamily enzyme YgiQ (UPF0313 family)